MQQGFYMIVINTDSYQNYLIFFAIKPANVFDDFA